MVLSWFAMAALADTLREQEAARRGEQIEAARPNPDISHTFGIGRAESAKEVVRTIASADQGGPADGDRL
jgi:hypothetical protein